MRQTHHITMKSYSAVGVRSLFRYKKMLLALMKKNSHRFRIKIIEYAIQGNHIHMLVKATYRDDLQNFFRVIAGHSGQKILKDYPILRAPGGAPILAGANATGSTMSVVKGCRKNQRQFWSYLLYSRIVSCGRDFRAVVSYIQKNTMELLKVIAYEPRLKRRKKNSS
jgi:REP element-mobilizing transposase RayT